MKRSISDPRVGTLKFKKSQRIWLSSLYFLLIGLVLGFLLFLGIFNPTGDVVFHWLTVNIFLVIGFILAIIFILVGWLVKFQRMYIYALLNLIGFGLVGRITTVGVVLTILGLVFTLSGIIVMRNFVNQHPKINLPENDGEVLA
jgi:O-antigen/teichoic acid export membrane protein